MGTSFGVQIHVEGLAGEDGPMVELQVTAFGVEPEILVDVGVAPVHCDSATV